MQNKYFLLLSFVLTTTHFMNAEIIKYAFLNEPHTSYQADVSDEQEALFTCLIKARHFYNALKDHKKALAARTADLKKEEALGGGNAASFKDFAESDIFLHSQLLSISEKQFTKTVAECTVIAHKIKKAK